MIVIVSVILIKCRIELTPRKNCTKVPLKGIFIGAKVIRGPDWEWGNQDGGRGTYIIFQLIIFERK